MLISTSLILHPLSTPNAAKEVINITDATDKDIDDVLSTKPSFNRQDSGKGLILHQSRKGMSIMGYRSIAAGKEVDALQGIIDSENSGSDSDEDYSDVDEVDMSNVEDVMDTLMLSSSPSPPTVVLRSGAASIASADGDDDKSFGTSASGSEASKDALASPTDGVQFRQFIKSRHSTVASKAEASSSEKQTMSCSHLNIDFSIVTDRGGLEYMEDRYSVVPHFWNSARGSNDPEYTPLAFFGVFDGE